ncbi:Fc.00g030040.m01.CDS01 [Cosmosporella sp. VM-42]
MPTYSPRTQAALLKAANRLFDLPQPAETLEELANGITLAQILHELDPEFDPSDLDTTLSTSKYLTNKRNIQTVYKGLFRFIRRQAPELGCQAKKFDYHAIAENPEPQGISQVTFPRETATTHFHQDLLTPCAMQLLAVMVSAAAMGPDNSTYVPRIQDRLDRETQAEIMQIIRRVQEDINNSRGEDDLDDAMDAVMEARDIDLLVEEQNAALRHELEVTKKNLSDYITRLEYLQQSHEELQYEKERNDRELEVLRKATQDGANSAESIKVLEAQVHEQMEIIARNEEAIRHHDKVKTHLEAEVKRLTQKSIQADELRDQVMEWKHRAEEFEKKANTADRYKQKLESQQSVVKEVQNLRYEKAELQEQLRSLAEDQDRSGRTRKAEDELTKMITQSEQHLWDERNQKNQLLKDVTALEEEVNRLRARSSHDEHYIQDLQEQLEQANAGQGATVLTGLSGSLEDELNSAATDDGPINLPLELSRLKAENDLLRSTVGSTGNAALLRRELDEEKRQRARIQQNFNEIFEKHAVGQDQLEAVINNLTGEQLVITLEEVASYGGGHILTGEYYRHQAFINLRTEFLQSNFENEQLKKENKNLVAQNADQGRELLEARTLLSAVDKDSIDALNELRGTDKLISESLKTELDRLRDELSFVVSDKDAQQSQLIEALLAKEKLRKEAEENRELSTIESSADPELADASKKSNEKIEKLRSRLIESRQVSDLNACSEPEVWPNPCGVPTHPPDSEPEPESFAVAECEMDEDELPAIPCYAILNEPAISKDSAPSETTQLEKAELDKIDLQRKLKAALDGEAYAAQKAASDQIIKNLQRENALIATAWYDLTSRLQSNHVVLQRRHDAPKSWLNKQRQMVNATPRR